jgi:adenosylcobyric acid synthase
MNEPAAARVIMVQGTASHAGKTVLAAALCRIYARRGYAVAPFKAQNMALNSAVTVAGDEMGRAQVYQAEAAGVEAHVDMNPVLLKPSSGGESQVVVMGRPVGQMSVAAYHAYQAEVWPVVTAALARLRAASELVVIEGAGSSAEINLRDSDIVNMKVACHACAPVLLVGDIDRGGVFAALVGHMELFSPPERALVRGFVVNKFRGDAAQLESGLSFLEERTGVPTLGVVPFLEGWRGDEEDSLALDRRPDGGPGALPRAAARGGAPLRVAVVRLPYLSNTTDFEALAAEPDVAVDFVSSPAGLQGAAAIVLPGTKSTVADLAWLRERGLAAALAQAVAAGVPVIGICGGYQMLGRRIFDPDGVESGVGETAGLGLLDVETTFGAEKRTVRVVGEASGAALAGAGTALRGYEIHLGRTSAAPGVRPLACLRAAARGGATHADAAGSGPDRTGAADGATHPGGAVSADGRVCGTYLHGLFDEAAFRTAFLNRLRAAAGLPARPPAVRGSEIERLADHVEAHLDMARLDAIVGLAPR